MTIVRQASNYADVAVNSMSISASRDVSSRRVLRNAADADKLERDGYKVERNKHPNGAYFAVIGNHPAHELEVGRIFAENGFAFTLDREGNAKVKIKGQQYKLPSSDGHTEGFTHEIYALNGEPNGGRVADAIKHSFKPFKYDRRHDVQSDIAITISQIGGKYQREHLAAGVAEFKRQRTEEETSARPLLYLHVDESTRKVYWWDIK